MKEVKFRARDKKTNSIRDVTELVWEKGKLIEVHFGTYESFGDTIPDWKKAEEVELLQFTGLKDKNDKEIYEGDIVKHTFRAFNDSGSCGHARYCNTGEVYYDKVFGQFMMKREGCGSPEFSLYVVNKMFDGDPPETNEVIGNI